MIGNNFSWSELQALKSLWKVEQPWENDFRTCKLLLLLFSPPPILIKLTYPTNNALLKNFRLSSDAEIFVDKSID